MEQDVLITDCGVIGGGLAGSVTALELADAGKHVDLFVKRDLIKDNNSYLIAGGLAAVPPQTMNHDSIKHHIQDTLDAGKKLNNYSIVEDCIDHFFSDVIEYLQKKGVDFDKVNGSFHLNKEGGHHAKRNFHVGDTTGNSIMKTLGELLRSHENITIHDKHMAIDLITAQKVKNKVNRNTCLGFYVYDSRKDSVKTIQCSGTFICTGGLGKIFLYTSNSDTSTGDGFAMCYRSGLPLVNMEFIQFHPTVFFDPAAEAEGERRFLLTEALRGAGAFLTVTKDAEEDFVLQYTPQGSHATRDVVSLAEDIEMRKHGLNHVWLNCTSIPKQKFKRDFKQTFNLCMSKGIDPTQEPIPVVYATHYSNGGVLVGSDSQTTLQGCYVIGETAYTGLHGATRLAGNSAPECVYFARKAATHFLKEHKNHKKSTVPPWDVGTAVESKDKITVAYYWEMIRRTMNSLCGMSRNQERLLAAQHLLQSLKESINSYYWNYQVTCDFLEVRNIAEIANVVVESALFRKESRASHYREDYPTTVDATFQKLTSINKDTSPNLVTI